MQRILDIGLLWETSIIKPLDKRREAIVNYIMP